VNGWQTLADYRVLFEYRYRTTAGAESLIARIPIHADQEIRESPERETTVVTDEMVRWDQTAAPALSIRGPQSIGRLSALVFLPSPASVGTVTLRRTFDHASGAPVEYTSLAAFIAAAGGPAAPERHGQIVFESLDAFLGAFVVDDGQMSLGDWNDDDAVDNYNKHTLQVHPSIRLPSVTDRLELVFEHTTLGEIGVVYLRSGRS
jgi:hypothetical protein